MNIIDRDIDGGKPFDWGKTSNDYAKYRDIYPREFYDKIVSRNLCVSGQSVLDLGTGTGVIPGNMYKFGAKWTGTDISENQIKQAKILSRGMDIDYYTVPAEEVNFPDNYFDVIVACQCFWYFDHDKLMPNLFRMLKPGGTLLVLYMAWLPFEDEIAGASEKLVLKYSPKWSGRARKCAGLRYRVCIRKNSVLLFMMNTDLKCVLHVRAGTEESKPVEESERRLPKKRYLCGKKSTRSYL